MTLLLLTLAVAVASAMILFRIYHMGLMLVLKTFHWNLEELKDYEITPTVKFWNQVFETFLIIGVIFKVVYI